MHTVSVFWGGGMCLGSTNMVAYVHHRFAGAPAPLSFAGITMFPTMRTRLVDEQGWDIGTGYKGDFGGGGQRKVIREPGGGTPGALRPRDRDP